MRKSNFSGDRLKAVRKRASTIKKAQDYKCFYCGVIVFVQSEWSNDHFIPACKGGAQGTTNVVMSCKLCNYNKGNRLPTKEEYDKFVSQSRKMGDFGKMRIEYVTSTLEPFFEEE